MLDLDRLAARIGLEPEDVAELLEVFLQTAPRAAQELDGALREQDFPLAVRAAHTIKGAAATVALEEVAERAGELERRLRALDRGAERPLPDEQNDDEDGLDGQLQALHNLLTHVRTAYEELS